MNDPRHILETLGAGVIVVAKEGTITYANGGAAAILERPVEELRDVNTLLPGLTDSARQERTVHLPSGRTLVLGLSVRVQADGSRTLLFQEITAIVALRRERDRLLQMAALGDALPSMLHELRNPLAAVTSLLELLVEEADVNAQALATRERPEIPRVPGVRLSDTSIRTDGRSSLADDLHAVLWEVRRMSLTLQGVGSMAHSVHSTQAIAIEKAVEDAVRVLTPTASRKGIALQAQVAAMPPLLLDWGVISGVVFNLTRNAIDACKRGDEIVVSAEVFDLPAPTFQLTVRDSGSGMDAQTLERCCDLFFTEKENGSGVGLALCKEIAETSGGALHVASTLHVGTTVTVTIPLKDLARREGGNETNAS